MPEKRKFENQFTIYQRHLISNALTLKKKTFSHFLLSVFNFDANSNRDAMIGPPHNLSLFKTLFSLAQIRVGFPNCVPIRLNFVKHREHRKTASTSLSEAMSSSNLMSVVKVALNKANNESNCNFNDDIKV